MNDYLNITQRTGLISSFFFFNDTATTEIYTLSLHDALPISIRSYNGTASTITGANTAYHPAPHDRSGGKYVVNVVSTDRKSTRLNSSHANISYAVFCLKKKKKIHTFTIFDITNLHILYLLDQ